MRGRMTPTHKRFLLFYLIFACVFIFTYFPIYRYVHGIIYDNVCKQARSVLAGGVTSLEASANVVLNTYTATARDSRFRPLKYVNGLRESSPSELSALVNMLRYSLVSADLVADAGIIRSEDLAVTRNRSFYSDTYYSFYPDFIVCQGMDFPQWYALLQSAGLPGQWLPEATYHSADYSADYHALTYARVWFSNPGGASGVYFATLNTDWLVPRLAEESALAQGSLRMTDLSGRVLLQRGAEAAENWEVITQRSAYTGLTVELRLPRAYLDQQLRPLENIMVLSISLFCVIALVLVLVFSHRSAEPMRRLMQSVDQAQLLPADGLHAPEERSPRHFLKNLQRDYELLASGISHLNGQLKTNAAVIAEQTLKLRDHLFTRALQNALYSPRERQDFGQLFPDFPQPFCLALIRCDWKAHSVEEAVHIRTAFLQGAQARLPSLYFSHVLMSGALLLVLREGSPDELEELRQNLLRETGVDSRMMITQPFSDTAQIAQAYEQAQCMEMMPAGAEVITYSDFCAATLSHVSMPLSYSALQEMYDALSQGNDALARVILNDCAATLLGHPDQLMLARHTHSVISHMLAQLKMEYPVPLFSVVIPSFDARELPRLFGQELPDCFQSISRSLREQQTPENGLSAQVVKFIGESLFSPDLCVTFVADRFGIAKATLQKIIKDATGATFSAYVGTQRLERAYRLLQEPGITVQQVSEMCGFSSTNSFYKAFRRKYGVAPSCVADAPEEEAEESRE